MTAVGDDLQPRFRPGVVKGPGGGGRGAHVVAALDDDGRDALQPIGPGDQLAFIEPASVDHVVILDPGDGDRDVVACEMLDGLGAGQEGDGLALPSAPCLGGGEPGRRVRVRQPPLVGGHQVLAFRLRYRRQEIPPFVRVNLRRAVAIEPVELGLAEGEDAAQDQLGDSLGVGFGISESERRAPGAAEHHPAFVAGLLAEPLDIVDQMPGGVGFEAGMGGGAAAAALVEEQDVVARRVELTAMIGAAAGAGAAVKEDDRLRARSPAALPVEAVAVADFEPARIIRLDRGVEGAAFVGHLRPHLSP
jgi:hypothetical protein